MVDNGREMERSIRSFRSLNGNGMDNSGLPVSGGFLNPSDAGSGLDTMCWFRNGT